MRQFLVLACVRKYTNQCRPLDLVPRNECTSHCRCSLGFGRDTWGIPPNNITTGLKWLYAAHFMCMVAECLFQLSILAFCLRIMIDQKSRLAVWVLMGLVTYFGLENTFAMIFQYMPIRLFWDGWRGSTAGLCGANVYLFGFVRGGAEIFLDLAILILPLPMLAKLNMSKKRNKPQDTKYIKVSEDLCFYQS
jgi:hypothetical protein